MAILIASKVLNIILPMMRVAFGCIKIMLGNFQPGEKKMGCCR